MRFSGTVAAVILAMAAAQTADAQSLASRVAAVRDGKVRMTFASRDDICGWGNGISNRGDRNNWNYNDDDRNSDVEYNRECSEGPARVVVEMDGGRPVAMRSYVGGRWRPASGVTDLGAVGVREATTWLLNVASNGNRKVSSSAIFATTLADSVEMGPALFDFARNDSKPEEAREQAIFWMSQVRDDDRVDGYLERLLRDSNNSTIQDKAIFGLSQRGSDRSKSILRDFVMNENASTKLRGQAIFWLGQGRRGESPEYLRSLYSRVRSDDLKDKVIFSISQQKGAETEKWLLDLVSNKSEPMEMRKKALFWAGQGGASTARLAALYERITEREMKDQMIFALSQRRDGAAFDKLMDIARNDPDREARRKAMFWLGQSKDPRVAQMLADIINR